MQCNLLECTGIYCNTNTEHVAMQCNILEGNATDWNLMQSKAKDIKGRSGALTSAKAKQSFNIGWFHIDEIRCCQAIVSDARHHPICFAISLHQCTELCELPIISASNMARQASLCIIFTFCKLQNMRPGGLPEPQWSEGNCFFYTKLPPILCKAFPDKVMLKH